MSELKCPFCKEEIISDVCCVFDKETRDYINGTQIYKCKKCGLFSTKELWQELIRTRKALDIAVDALKEQQRWFGVIRVSLISHLNNQYGTLFKSYDADPTVVNVKRANDILNTALEQIIALEQKD